MRLLTDPSGFDRGGEHLEARIGRYVRHIAFFARQSTIVRRRARPRCPVDTAYDCRACRAYGHPQRGHGGRGQRRFSGERGLIGDVVFARHSSLKIIATPAG